jgi:hypothetical protein
MSELWQSPMRYRPHVGPFLMQRFVAAACVLPDCSRQLLVHGTGPDEVPYVSAANWCFEESGLLGMRSGSRLTVALVPASTLVA